MSIDFTIAIPTYNGASRLPKLFERLRSQTSVENISWEVIIVDNNSSDNTAEIVQHYQTQWPPDIHLKYCFEAQQGAAFARQHAVREASGEFIGFIDDDVLPAPDWIAKSYSFAKEYPKGGAFGGQIHGDFEVEPPENFEKIKAFLAIRSHGSTPHLFDADNIRLPPTAALLIRKQAWQQSVPKAPVLRGKTANEMVNGDDYEPLLHMHKTGWEIWYNPTMIAYHQIPHWRLERDYLLSLARACGLPTCQLRMINAKPWQKPSILIRTFLGNLRRVVVQYIKHKGRMKTDLISAFEMEFFLGSLISPLYFLKQVYIRKRLRCD